MLGDGRSHEGSVRLFGTSPPNIEPWKQIRRHGRSDKGRRRSTTLFERHPTAAGKPESDGRFVLGVTV
jgi:hypothetical protein